MYNWKLYFLLLVLTIISPLFANEYWYIQIGSYQSKTKAIKSLNASIVELDTLWNYDKNRDETNYLHLHQQDGSYKLLVGPYAERKQAVKWKGKIPKASFLVLLDKNYYDNFVVNERFVTKEISFEIYESQKSIVNASKSLYPISKFDSFIKDSLDHNFRLVEKDEQFYIEKCSISGCIPVYHLNQDFGNLSITINKDLLYWDIDNTLYLYLCHSSIQCIPNKTYKIFETMGNFEIVAIPAYELENGRSESILHQLNIENIQEMVEIQRLLEEKNIILLQKEGVFYLGENNTDLKKIEGAINVIGYFPTESLILFQGEGETEISIDIIKFEMIDKSPYQLQYSFDETKRINGKSFEPLDRNELFIEEKINNVFEEIYRIGMPFPIFVGGIIDSIFWGYDGSIYFRFCENFDCRYYQLDISALD